MSERFQGGGRLLLVGGDLELDTKKKRGLIDSPLFLNLVVFIFLVYVFVISVDYIVVFFACCGSGITSCCTISTLLCC